MNISNIKIKYLYNKYKLNDYLYKYKMDFDTEFIQNFNKMIIQKTFEPINITGYF